MLTEPLVALPVLKPVPIHVVLLFDVHVSIVDCPSVMVEDAAVRVAVVVVPDNGATAMVASAVPVPPDPVQEIL
jgi:hypothetical protein